MEVVMANGKSFIDFILDAQNDPQLSTEFLKQNSPDDLQSFFKNKGYDIDPAEIDKLMKVREKAIDSVVDKVKY